MGWGNQPGCCCGGRIGPDCFLPQCRAGTAPAQLIATIPPNIFTRLSGCGTGADCSSWISGSWLLERDTSWHGVFCGWVYDPTLSRDCVRLLPITTCNPFETYTISAVVETTYIEVTLLMKLSNISCNNNVRIRWVKTLGEGVSPHDCANLLAEPQTLTWSVGVGSLCYADEDSTVTLVAA